MQKITTEMISEAARYCAHGSRDMAHAALEAAGRVSPAHSDAQHLREILRRWLSLDPSFKHASIATLRSMCADGNNRFARVVLETRIAVDGDYPECSGNPNDCPENEGYGCCLGKA